MMFQVLETIEVEKQTNGGNIIVRKRKKNQVFGHGQLHWYPPCKCNCIPKNFYDRRDRVGDVDHNRYLGANNV